MAVRPGLTEIDEARNWALRIAEELVKGSSLSTGKAVTVKKNEGGGIYVDTVQVFSQELRFAKGGSFHGEYASLKLP